MIRTNRWDLDPLTLGELFPLNLLHHEYAMQIKHDNINARELPAAKENQR